MQVMSNPLLRLTVLFKNLLYLTHVYVFVVVELSVQRSVCEQRRRLRGLACTFIFNFVKFDHFFLHNFVNEDCGNVVPVNQNVLNYDL
jgi:hypothetical protein